jgi:hypothetical protein
MRLDLSEEEREALRAVADKLRGEDKPRRQ